MFICTVIRYNKQVNNIELIEENDKEKCHSSDHIFIIYKFSLKYPTETELT